MYFEKTYEIDSRDVDCFSLCRASALLGYLQDAAGGAALAFGAANHQMVEKHRHCWMVTRTRFALDRPLPMGGALTLKTWHRGGDKPLMYRDFDLILDGQAVGQALSIWVLVDLDHHTMTRPDHFPEFPGTDGGELIRDTKLPKLRLPGELAPVEARTFHYSDTDANGHVNNTRYADLLCDAVRLQNAPTGSFVRAMHIDYLRECKAGETLGLSLGQDGGVSYVRGVGPEGEARFQGALTLEKNSPLTF